MLDIHDFLISKNDNQLNIDQNLEKICIAAFHSSIPYIMNFKNDGWFSWEKNKDSVIVICPTGHVKMEVRKLNRLYSQIRFLNIYGQCPRCKEGDIFTFKNTNESINIIDSAFPVLSYLSSNDVIKVDVQNSSVEGNMEICHRDSGKNVVKQNKDACEIEQMIQEHPSSISVVGMNRSCKYHRRLQVFLPQELVPDNTCAIAYHSLYPTMLSLLYHGKLKKKLLMHCPGIENTVTFILERTSKPTKFLLTIAEKLLRFLRFPMDIIADRVTIRVSNIDGNCIGNLKTGDKFLFGSKNILCASSFDNLLGAIVDQASVDESCKHIFQCTSDACRVQYKLIKNG
ncbi:MAG TPA: hypothetical protein VKM55_18580 [Candidatus Lokiarchaeia archaeon]|nr:hypothetical protein [Candidatus Lokiarchaeia archaeon]